MVQIDLEVDSAGLVKAILASGHAKGFRKGENPVCAAATVLIRTFLRWLDHEKSILVDGDAPSPGCVFARIGTVPEEMADRYLGACRFLITGLTDLQEDDPEQIDIRVKRFKE
jgi:uncharacterized protein YsxB (DUF464 family)